MKAEDTLGACVCNMAAAHTTRALKETRARLPSMRCPEAQMQPRAPDNSTMQPLAGQKHQQLPAAASAYTRQPNPLHSRLQPPTQPPCPKWAHQQNCPAPGKQRELLPVKTSKCGQQPKQTTCVDRGQMSINSSCHTSTQVSSAAGHPNTTCSRLSVERGGWRLAVLPCQLKPGQVLLPTLLRSWEPVVPLSVPISVPISVPTHTPTNMLLAGKGLLACLHGSCKQH